MRFEFVKMNSLDFELTWLCRLLKVSRQGYHKWLRRLDRPYKYAELLARIEAILEEDEENAGYGRYRMRQALEQRGGCPVSEGTLGKVMSSRGIGPGANRRKPNSLTREDKAAQKEDDLLGRDFKVEMPNSILVTDLTEVECSDGKLYVSTIFDLFDAMPLGLAMADSMRAELPAASLKQAAVRFDLRGAVIHDDRGSQYTSKLFQELVASLHMHSSMNSAAGRCFDNARCESLWARFKVEKIYGIGSKKFSKEEMKSIIWRYFMSYWSNRRVNTSNDGLPPAEKRRRYYEYFAEALAAQPI
jgi:transposase InsO family protein